MVLGCDRTVLCAVVLHLLPCPSLLVSLPRNDGRGRAMLAGPECTLTRTGAAPEVRRIGVPLACSVVPHAAATVRTGRCACDDFVLALRRGVDHAALPLRLSLIHIS